MISHGADSNILTHDKRSPAQMAYDSSKIDIAKLIQEHSNLKRKHGIEENGSSEPHKLQGKLSSVKVSKTSGGNPLAESHTAFFSINGSVDITPIGALL